MTDEELDELDNAYNKVKERKTMALKKTQTTKPAATKTTKKAPPAAKADNSMKKGQVSDWAAETKKAAKTWNKARNAPKGGSFENPEVADGSYPAQLEKAVCKIITPKDTKKPKQGLFELHFIMLDSANEGKKLHRSDFFDLRSTDDMTEEEAEKALKNMENFSRTIQGFNYETGGDEPLDMSDFPTLADTLNAENPKPKVKVGIKNWTSADKSKKGINIFVNGPLDE